MSEESGTYTVEGLTEVRREARLPFASKRFREPTGDEFRTITQTLGLTGSMVGQLLGVDGRTVRKWIGGERGIPYSAWRLLLIHAGLALEDPDEPNVAELEVRARADVRAQRVADEPGDE